MWALACRVTLFAGLLCSIGLGARGSGAVDPVPPEHQATFDELSARLTSFEAQLDAQWDGVVGPRQFAGPLSAANGNKSVAVLEPAGWIGSLAMLDAYQALGVEVIKIEVDYPVFTPAFQSWLAAHPPAAYNPYTATVPDFLGTPTSFYNEIVAEIRSRGMGVWIEHGTLFADYSPTPPGAYFADMRTAGLAATRARYTAERTAEAALLVSQLEPDYFAILEEPATQNDNFGYFPGNVPLFDEAGWLGFVQAAVAAIDTAAPGSATKLGAGSGTWDGIGYTAQFAAMPELDFVDLHLYPFGIPGQDFLQNVIDWSAYIRSVDPSKEVLMGETWLYKVRADEVAAQLDYNTIIARDVWSFWEPLDAQFHEMLLKLIQVAGIEMVMPFWTQYYWGYLTWGDPTLAGLEGPALVAEAASRAGPNVLTGPLTGSGVAFEDVVATTLDADGDGVANATDNCQRWPNAGQALPPWTLASVDPDCDGFPSLAPDGGLAAETFVGTTPTVQCAATSVANDEPSPDRWPLDMNDDQRANMLDVLMYIGKLNKIAPDPLYVQRFDLSGDSRVNLVDVLKFVPFLNQTCT